MRLPLLLIIVLILNNGAAGQFKEDLRITEEYNNRNPGFILLDLENRYPLAYFYRTGKANQCRSYPPEGLSPFENAFPSF